MGLFKNEVGRPSNETLKKRRMFYIVLAVLAVLIIGGGGYFTYTKLKPKKVESTGKDAALLKFKEEKVEHYCINVEAPVFAKNWRVQVYWKKKGASSYGNNKLASYNHYNDGVKKQKVCFNAPKNYFLPEVEFRVLVKATTGANDKIYTKVNPNDWKPFGWNYNKSIGWAYKDYFIPGFPGDTYLGKFCYKNPGYKDYCTDIGSTLIYVNDPEKVEYNRPTIVKIKFGLSNYYKDWFTKKEIWPAWYVVKVYNAKNNQEVTRTTCKKIEPNREATYNLSLIKPNETYYTKIYVYKNGECNGDYEDVQRTNGYRYTK